MVFPELNDLEWRILNVTCGGIERLPYGTLEQDGATAALVRLGLIRRTMEDDQPTTVPTEEGKAMREALIAMGVERKDGAVWISSKAWLRTLP